jgi:hypothetical protein
MRMLPVLDVLLVATSLFRVRFLLLTHIFLITRDFV